jgi:drug/metabolite transporter (DMT)-like permease
VLYYYVLGKTDLSVAVPVANGLTFAFAGLTEAILDKRIPSRKTIEGSVLILIGAYIAMSSKI